MDQDLNQQFNRIILEYFGEIQFVDVAFGHQQFP